MRAVPTFRSSASPGIHTRLNLARKVWGHGAAAAAHGSTDRRFGADSDDSHNDMASGDATQGRPVVSQQQPIRYDAPAREYYGQRAPRLEAGSGFAPSSLDSSAVNRHSKKYSPEVASRFRMRRMSHDNIGTVSDEGRKFVIHVDETLRQLLEQEDTDNNYQITIEDKGPKVISLGTASSNGYSKIELRGTYPLSNLLQELSLAKAYGQKTVILDERRIFENPVDRLHRRIRDSFWHNLERRMDAGMIDKLCLDPKNRGKNKEPRIYVPYSEDEIFNYYVKVAHDRPELGLVVEKLPKKITAEWMRDKNHFPGILALAMEKYTKPDGSTDLRGFPFVVPGGRFNEQYGWDSYFEALGLLVDGKVDPARGMVENFIFEIEHYGKILNANRSYYIMRSQPPFLTDMTIQVYRKIKTHEDALDFLRRGIMAAIKEYYTVWMSPPRYDPKTGLSRYAPEGLGIPPETEATHFTHVIMPYANKHNMSFEEFTEAYNNSQVKEPGLDEFFRHDRAVRESGHDTTARLEGVCADLATIDLNALLYKYEADISAIILHKFDDRFVLPNGEIETSAIWDRRARSRRAAVDKYLWNEAKGMYFDYNTVTGEQQDYESATTFWALWAGVANPKQAYKMVDLALPKFEMHGGIVAGTKESLQVRGGGVSDLTKPNRQWDYPTGWAPHQIMAWQGLLRYGYEEEAHRLLYRWLYTMTKSSVDYNGVVVEKYNVVTHGDSHVVQAEYGNQGADFRGVATEGFGWVNASFQIGLSYCNTHIRRALGTITPPEVYFRETALKEEKLNVKNVVTPSLFQE